VGQLLKGSEGGISFVNFNDLQKGDMIESYEEVEIAKIFKAVVN
jgi:hypothetical protein